MRKINRRKFMAGIAPAVAGVTIAPWGSCMPAYAASRGDGFDFLVLGDIHVDQMNHHDWDWMQREKPTVIGQCENYSRLTRETTPKLFAALRGQIERNDRIQFVGQLGDLVQGLAGTPELARQHCADGVKFVRDAGLGVPFLMTKGNHDITGPGAHEAFDEILRPFMREQLSRFQASRQDSGAVAGARENPREQRHASYCCSHGDTLFVHFDGYVSDSFDWLDQVLARRTEKHLMVMLHQPVVPYTPRSTWCIYASESQQDRRTRLLNLLGEHRAIVFTAHLHKHGIVVRQTERGPFVQVAAISVLPSLSVAPRSVLTGVDKYGPDLVKLNVEFEPHTVERRRAVLEAEAPFISYFEYADAPGYVLVSVRGDNVAAQFFCGVEPTPWRQVNLTQLLDA